MYKRISFIASMVIWVLLPKCSVCFMAYMGLFSAIGLGHWMNHPYILPVIWGLLAVNIFSVLYLVIKERQYLFAAVSCAGAAVFVLNKLYWQENPVNFITGVILLAAAGRIRLARVRAKKCVFSEPVEPGCA